MKRTIICFLCIFVLMIPVVFAADADTTVYITETGGCYHRRSCGSLNKSRIKTTLGEAVEDGYLPCERCHPPKLTETKYYGTTAVTTPVTETTPSDSDTTTSSTSETLPPQESEESTKTIQPAGKQDLNFLDLIRNAFVSWICYLSI